MNSWRIALLIEMASWTVLVAIVLWGALGAPVAVVVATRNAPTWFFALVVCWLVAECCFWMARK